MRTRGRTAAVLAAAALLAGVSAGCGSTVRGQANAATGNAGELGAGPSTRATTAPTDLSGASDVGGQTANAAGQSAVGARTATRPGAAAATIAAKGPGWNEREVFVGVVTVEDLHNYVKGLGIEFDPGSGVADVNGIVDDLNRRGGVLGRKIVPVYYDNRTADVAANPEAAAQANCTHFTQDTRVVAVVNFLPAIDTAAFHACLQRANTPLVVGGTSLYDDEAFKQYGPYLWTTVPPNMTSFGPGWVSALARLKYFSAWNAATGAPGPAPVKVGILQPDDPIGRRLASAMTSRLKSLGFQDVRSVLYAEDASQYGSQMSAAALRFRADGVTHVLTIPPIAAATLVFVTTAEQQHYRPRYALNSYWNPTSAAANLPQAQLAGAIGLGWMPGTDVNTAQDPGGNDAQRLCRAALESGGQRFPDNKRLALWNGYGLCDVFKLLVGAATQTRGLGPASLADGIATIGPGFAVASTFSSGLSQTSHAMQGLVMDLAWDASCTCFRYSGRPHAL